MAMEKIGSLGYGGQQLNDKLPRVLSELQGLTISGPLTGTTANTAIAVTEGIDVQDSILKVLMFAAGVPSDITSTTSIVDLRAKGTLTLAAVVANDTAVVAGKTYTFKTLVVNLSTNLPPYTVPVGATDTISATNLAAAINAQDSTVTASAVGAVVTVQAVAEGTGGNAITIVGGAHLTASAGTLAGGSATNAIKTSTVTTSNTVVVFWYKKSRVIGQA